MKVAGGGTSGRSGHGEAQRGLQQAPVACVFTGGKGRSGVAPSPNSELCDQLCIPCAHHTLPALCVRPSCTSVS